MSFNTAVYNMYIQTNAYFTKIAKTLNITNHGGSIKLPKAINCELHPKIKCL